MHKRAGFIAMLGLTLCAWPALADTTQGQRAAAAELLHVLGIERNMMAGATAMIDVQVRQNPLLSPYRDVMLKWAGSFMTWDAVSGQLIDLYAQTFTEAELKELTAFYKTPTGQKALTELPGLMQKGAAIGADLGKAHTPELEKMIRDRQEEIQKSLEKPKVADPD